MTHYLLSTVLSEENGVLSRSESTGKPVQVAGHLLPQVESDDPPINVQQRLAVAERLGRFEHPEGERGLIRTGLVRNWHVPWMVRGELDEEPVPGVSFV